MITITDAALEKIKTLLSEEIPGSKVRAFVQGGGCSGMSYGFAVDQEQNEDDFVVDNKENLVIIDSISMQYLEGATIDFVDDLMGSSFRIMNPNAETSCGCGSSFSVSEDFFDDHHI